MIYESNVKKIIDNVIFLVSNMNLIKICSIIKKDNVDYI